MGHMSCVWVSMGVYGGVCMDMCACICLSVWWGCVCVGVRSHACAHVC